MARLSRSQRLEREAARLRRAWEGRTGLRCAVPPLLFVTDPDRTPDPAAVAARLPEGSGVVFRGFGRPDAEDVARRLAALASDRRLILLVGADPELAARVGAHGVHLPERLLALAPALRRRRPGWLLTGAAHSPAALRRAETMGLDAALVSPAFASASPSAVGVRAWGPTRLAAMARSARVPLFAVGGVDGREARRLREIAGLAAVDGLANR